MKENLSLKNRALSIRPQLILVFIPILFTVLFGLVMSPVYVENIPISILDFDNSSESRGIVESFYDCSAFKVSENYNTEAKIEEEMLKGNIKGALIIPEGFGKDILKKKGGKALMLIDGTNFLVGNNIQLYSSTILSMANASGEMKMLEAGGMVPYMVEKNILTLNIADRVLYNPQLGYFYYLFAALLGIFVQQTILAVTPTILIQEKNRLKNSGGKPKWKEVWQKISLYVLLNTASAIFCLVIANKLFYYPLKGDFFYFIMLHFVFLLCCLGVSLVLATIFDDATHCIQFVMFLAIPTMLTCGYGWPEYMMPKGFALIMKGVWPLYYYVNPLKDIMLKGGGFEVISSFTKGGILFATFWITFGYAIYVHKIKILNSIKHF